MAAIRVIFDGRAFIPQQPISLPNQSEAVVIIEDSPLLRSQLDEQLRAYYTSESSDEEDEAWARATAPQSDTAWNAD
jgi:hypothetical protein